MLSVLPYIFLRSVDNVRRGSTSYTHTPVEGASHTPAHILLLLLLLLLLLYSI